MHLFNLVSFAKQFGIDLTVPDFQEAVVEASKAATPTVASRFRYGGFDTYSNRRDVFQVRRMYDAGAAQNLSLRLSRGFVDTSASFTAYYTANPLYVRNNDTDLLTDLQDVNKDGQSDYLFIDAERGVLSVYNIDLTDQWVVVTYTGGLETASDDEYQGVPDWLSQAARAQTALMLKENRAFSVEGDTDMKTLTGQLNALWSRHARVAGSMVLPVMSRENVT